MVYFAKWKIVLVGIVCFLGVAFAAPNFIPKNQADLLPGWLPRQQVSLGLDLQGGSHLLLEVEIQAVVREYIESLVDSMRLELRKARIRYQGLGVEGEAAVVTIKDPDKVEEARGLLRALDPSTRFESDGNKISIALTDKALADRKNAAIQQSIEIVRRRVDETGTREPTIQRQGADRILVQLPGVDDPERIKRLLGKTAKMSFHLVDQKNSVEAAMAGRIPPGSWLLPSDEGDGRMYLIR